MSVCKNLPAGLRKESGMPGVGVCIWRDDRSVEFCGETTVEDFLSREENCSGEWFIDGGWGGPPGPIKVHWNGKVWIDEGFPPWVVELEGLSNDPAVAYEQGRRDGRAETLHAVELAATDNQQTQPKICPVCHGTGQVEGPVDTLLKCDFCDGTGKLRAGA